MTNMSCNTDSFARDQDLYAGRGDNCDHSCPQSHRNLYQDLCTKFQDLFQKWNSNQPRRRIKELAMPKHVRAKFRPCVNVSKPKWPQVQIIRDVPTLSTRSEQLAYSPVRRLIATRDATRNYVPPIIYERFNKYIHRGMYSMYARLGNALPPVIKHPTKPWTKAQWEFYMNTFKNLSIPKRIHEPPKIKRASRSMAQLELRLEYLSAPKSKPVRIRPRPDVSPAALKYVVTERVAELSKPKPSREPPPRKHRTFRGKKYDASDRTKELARHREKKTAVSDTKENPFQVAPNALKARTTERVKNLAKHKEYMMQEAKDAIKISPAALKATASKRIIELAQPKKPATSA